MADGKLIETISKQAYEDLQKYIQMLMQGLDVTVQWEKELNKMGIPSQVQSSYKTVATEIKKIDGAQSDYNKTMQAYGRIQSQTLRATTQVGKETEKLRQFRNKTNRETRLQVKLESQLFGEYERLDAALQKVERRMRDLMIRKEMGNDLSEKEEKILTRLTVLQNKYRGVLDKTDQKMGNYRRSVGNYSSAFDGLGFSMAQITREAPAFAHNLSTGFMAISNNIPMLVDEINKLRTANRALALEGKPTVNILKRVGGALFGWQSLLSLGIVLLTVYGEKIAKWVGSLFEANDALSKTAENTKKVNEEAAKLASDSIASFQSLIAVIQDETKSEELRYKAKKKLAEDYPDFNQNILDEEDATNKVSRAIDLYIEKLTRKAKAQAAMNLMQEKFTKLVAQEIESQSRREKLLKRAEGIDASAMARARERYEQTKDEAELLKTANEIIRSRTAEIQRVSQAQGAGAAATDSGRDSLDSYNESLAKEAEIQDEINGIMGTYLDNLDDLELKQEKNNKKREKAVEIFKDLVEWGQKYIAIQKLIEERLKTDATTELEKMGGWTETMQQNWEAIVKEMEKADAEQKKILANKLKQLEVDGYMKEAFMSLGNTLGIQGKTISDLFDSIRYGFGDVGESVEQFGALFTDVMGSMTAAENARIDQRISRLQDEKELAIAFAGDSAEAREAVEERYTRRIAQLKARQAQNNKSFAVIQSIINTATAITKTFAELGFPAGIPAAAIIAGLGAAQTAIIASQPIPQFKEGVRSFEGGLAVVGDGGKNEPITDRQGRLLGVSPDRPTLVDLPQGANVYKDYEDFNKELNATLGLNDINPFGASVYPRINKRSGNAGIDTKALEKAFGNAIKSRPSTVVTMDKNGFRTFVRSQYGQSEMLNNRTSFKGMDV